MVTMKIKRLFDGEKIPVLGLGTWEVGGMSQPDYSQDEEVVKAWRAALEMGYTHIDTAEMYGGGHTEELVAQTIAGFEREDLFINSKVWETNLLYDDVLKAFEGSLRRLQTDYLDLYLIHWPNDDIPMESTFRALNELVETERLRYVGVSNFNLNQLKKAQELSSTPLATNQVPYSLKNRKYANNGVLAYCQESDILLTAYTPIEKGSLKSHGLLQSIAAKYAATPIQIALSWLIRQPGVITIPQSVNIEHLKDNLESVEIELTDEDFERINQIA